MNTRTLARACLLFVLPLLFASMALAQSFNIPQKLGSPNGPSDVFVADFNGDGKPDFVTTQSLSNAVTVFLNQGTGTFVDQGSAHYLTGRGPFRLVAADFNGNGRIDIVTANCDTSAGTG